MLGAGKEQISALMVQVRSVSGQVGTGADVVQRMLTAQASSISHQIDLWRVGEASSFKIISGDFQTGRAIIVMDGLRLRNRGNAIETVPFSAIKAIQELHSEKRASTAERARGAAIGSAIGGVAGAAAGILSFARIGGIGAAVGGTLGALLASKQKYQICRVALHDERKVIAVAASTNWLALLASIPEQPKSRLLPWRR